MVRSRVLTALCALYVAALAAMVVATSTGFASADQVTGPVMVVFSVVSVVFAVRVTRHPNLERPIRRAVRTLTVALAFALATPLIFLATGPKSFPAPGDGAHMAFVIVLFATLQLLPLRRATRRERWKTALDASTVVLGASMVLWYKVIGPAADAGHGVRTVVAAAAYPVVDLLVLFGFARALLRGTGHVTRRPLQLLGTGMLLFFVGDAYLGYAQAQVDHVQRTPWQFVCWLTTHFLLAGGAVELWRQVTRPAAAAGSDRRRVAGNLPYVGVGVGYLLMVVAVHHESRAYPWLGLVVGGMGITGLVVVRQILAQRDSIEAGETDTLTGLANRGRLHDDLARALRRAARSGGAVAVLLIDLNGFKQINDTLGHQAGDGLLVAVADAIRRSVRQDDRVGRLGGDEFAVVLPSISHEAIAVALASRITEAAVGPFVVGDRPMTASASVGVAVSEPGETSPDTLLQRADMAMYAVKRGRPDATDAWVADLPAAAAAGQLRLSYEPVRALTDGRIVGASVVPCWDHPERGAVRPEVFGPPAERLGVAGTIRSWVLARAVAEAARWDDGRYVSVPVTGDQLAEAYDVLTASALDGRRLVLELPGDASTEDAALTRLRALGVRIAVTGFGTSYAALRALGRGPVDLLKLDDRPGPADAGVAAAVIRLSQALGLATLIDGVEIPSDVTYHRQ